MSIVTKISALFSSEQVISSHCQAFPVMRNQSLVLRKTQGKGQHKSILGHFLGILITWSFSASVMVNPQFFAK